MPNTLLFHFENQSVRVLLLNNDPWFVAKDVCEALNLSNSRAVIKALDDDEKGVSLIDTLGGAQQITVINESGLYTIILRCRSATKPGTIAHRFRKWVTGQVLPTIRKTGGYLGRGDTFQVSQEETATERGGIFQMPQEKQATAGSRRHDFEAAPGRCRHAPDIETHLTHAVDHLSGALHNLTEALQQAQGRRRQHLSHLVQQLAPAPSSPPPSCYTPEPENALSESMQEKLAAWLHGRSRCTLYEVCLEVFGIPPEDLNRAGQTRLGCMLKALGWVSQRETVAPNQRVKVYRPVEV